MTTNSVTPTSANNAIDSLRIAESRLQMLYEFMELKTCSHKDRELNIEQESVEGVMQNLMDSIGEIRIARSCLDKPIAPWDSAA
jgi:threonine synthase